MATSIPLTKDQIIGSFRRDLLILSQQLNDLSRSIFLVPPKVIPGVYTPTQPYQKLRLNQQQYKLLIARNTFNKMYVRSVAPLMGFGTPQDAKRFDPKFVSSDQWLVNFLKLNLEFPGKLDLLNQQLTGVNKKTPAQLVAYHNDFFNWFKNFVSPWYQNPLAPGPTGNINY
jgi:hypothetical protein